MDEREYQISNLRRIFTGALFSPFFRENPKYTIEGRARISYADIMDNKYIIRDDRNTINRGHFWSDHDAPVVARYNCLEEVIDDGWALD